MIHQPFRPPAHDCHRRLPLARASLAAIVIALSASVAAPSQTSIGPPASAAAVNGAAASQATPAAGSGSLESAAAKAGDTGRKVAMSLIGLGFAIAAIVLTFKRDFREAAGILAIGLVAVLLATPAGIGLLRSTVSSLVGA